MEQRTLLGMALSTGRWRADTTKLLNCVDRYGGITFDLEGRLVFPGEKDCSMETTQRVFPMKPRCSRHVNTDGSVAGRTAPVQPTTRDVPKKLGVFESQGKV